MWNEKTVTVVLPAYNEEAGIVDAIRDFFGVSYFRGERIVDEVLVVNNNSSDQTGALARAAGARVIDEPRQGYGSALQRGLKEANTDIIVTCEPDGTFVGRDIIKLLSYAEDFDVVCGTRTTRELFWKEANMGFFLRWGNFLVAKMMELLYDTCSLSDCGCTFRLYSRTAVTRIRDDLFVTQSHFLPNVIIAARMNDVSFIEIPVTYRGRVGVSKITGSWTGVWKTGLSMIFLILRMWPRFLLSSRRHSKSPS
jgi:glycosyltransferase involved in cell wall biosynthesis